MTSTKVTIDELEALDAELLPERTVLSSLAPAGGNLDLGGIVGSVTKGLPGLG